MLGHFVVSPLQQYRRKNATLLAGHAVQKLHYLHHYCNY